MDAEYILENPRGRCMKKFIRNRFPDEYPQVLKMEGTSFSEKLYNYIYNSPSHTCPICGKETKYRDFKTGYSKFCSIKCVGASAERMDNIRKTVKERYGVENASQSEEIKRKKKETIEKNYGGFGWGSEAISEKSGKTVKERYGVENASQSEEIKKKKEETCLRHYGVRHAARSEEVRKKTEQSMMERYGVKNIFEIKEIRERAQKQTLKDMFEKHDGFLGRDEEGRWIIRCPHPDCSACTEKAFHIYQQTYHDRLRNGSELCTHLMEEGKKNRDTTIELDVRRMLTGHDIQFQTNVRDIIPPKEIDIWIPDKRIAIECNGIYWHSKKDRNYHREKHKACEENGIQLLTLWEDWIVNKPQIVESMLMSKLGLSQRRVYARNCMIREITSKKSNEFLEANHIQGKVNSGVRLGLFLKNELVCVMLFNRKRGCMGSSSHTDSTWELSRYCSMLNTTVVGGASRLLKYFISNWHPGNIYSFSSNDISDGGLYYRLGFEQVGECMTYCYVDPRDLKRYHRTSFTRKEIIRKGLAPACESWTELMAVESIGLCRIWDSGKKKWEMML